MKKDCIHIKKSVIVILSLLVAFTINSYGQSVKRQCISSLSASKQLNNITISHTAGQSFNTVTNLNNNVPVLPGFQQPVNLKVEVINSPKLKTFNLNVFPNPAAYSVTIESNGLIENSTIQVTNILGIVMLNETVEQLQSYTIDCGNWNNGIYIITVSDKNQNITSLKLTITK